MANTQRQLEGVSFDTLEPWLLTFNNIARAKTVTQAADEIPTFAMNVETADEKQINLVKGAILKAALELFPNGISVKNAATGEDVQLSLADAIKNGVFATPFVSGDRLADEAKRKSEVPGAKQRLREWSRGKWVLSARSKEDRAPLVSVFEGGKFVPVTEPAALQVAQGKHFYGGAKVLFGVWFRAYNAVGDGKPGVKAYFNEIAKVGDGDRLFGEARTAGSRFTEYRGTAVNESVTGGQEESW